MRFSELEPNFLRYSGEIRKFVNFNDAQGVMFLCPKCFETNKGSMGTHWIEVTFSGKGVPDGQGSKGTSGQDTRWNITGSSVEDISTTPSIALIGGCSWHGYITNGSIVNV